MRVMAAKTLRASCTAFPEAEIVWFGTHKQYDKIDAKKVSYVKTNKK